jgi:hypothetical protein
LDTLWIPFGFPLDSVWIPFGFRLDSLWIPFGFPLDSLWIGYKSGSRMKRLPSLVEGGMVP